MDPDDRLRVISRQDSRHPRTEVIAPRSVARISQLGHQPVPPFRDIVVINARLQRTRRESVTGQRWQHHVEICEYRQHLQVVEKTARPAVRKDQRHTFAGCGALAHKMNALRREVIELVEFPFPSTPVEIVRPISNQASQPLQLGALLPADARNLVRPSRVTKPCPKIVEHVIRDMNLKRFHTTPFGPRPATISGLSSRSSPTRRALSRLSL